MEATTDKKNLLSLLAEAFDQRGLGQHTGRRKAMELFSAKGLPTSKSEEYRFTPVVRALESNFTAAAPTKSTSPQRPEHLWSMPCNLVVFINGVYSASHSILLDPHIKINRIEIGTTLLSEDPFALLNHAFAENEVTIDIPSHHTVEQPLAVVYWFDPSAFVFANPRWTCRVGAGSKLSVLEYTLAESSSTYFNNKQSFIEVGEHAILELTTLQQGSKDEVLVNNSLVNLASSSRVYCYTGTLEGKLVRNNLTLLIDGEGIDAHLHGLYLVGGSSLVDNHTVVDHRKPNSQSNELYKGVMDGSGKAVFNGKIFVRPDAQKTNAFQSNRNILLSETSNIHTKPQLEIWADDVKCSHGCTTGQLDEEALFYLRSRGLAKDTAKGMLLNAFASETLEGIPNESIRAQVDQLIQNKLHSTIAQ